MFKKVAVLGVGLIGGSLALALRERSLAEQVIGYDRDSSALLEALERRVVDATAATAADAVEAAELTVIAVPVGAVAGLLRELRDAWPVGRAVTDVGSCKASVRAAAESVFGEVPPEFVLGHPIAGREASGVAAAQSELFQQHRVILTPLASTNEHALETVSAMWRAVGAEVERLDVELHDRILAATSHLPHILAYATVSAVAETEDVEEIFHYAAGGFRDFTRIASSNAVMWRDICMDNREAILAAVDRYQQHLARLRTLIEAQDGAALETTFAEAKAIRDQLLAKHQI